MSKKIIRISTVPQSLNYMLEGQLRMLAGHYEIVGVSSPGDLLNQVHVREGIRVIGVPMERHISLWKDFVSLWRLIRVFRKEKPDMVHSVTPKAGLLAMLAAWITRVPVRMHTFTGLVFPTAERKIKKILMLADRLICYCATHINPEGEGVKKDLKDYRITAKPMFVVANGNINGIDMQYFSRTVGIEAAAASYREEGCFTFCFVGRIVKDKGINELVRVFRKLYEEQSHVRLLLVGPFEKELDPLLPETEQAILHHPGIRFMGWQNDVRPFLAASDVFVFPSYREGFPNVVMQAGAMGLPSIVTDINGCNEIIIPYRNGILVPSKDEKALYETMRYVMENPREISLMVANARTMIRERYERRIVWEALLDTYRRILQNN